MTDDTEHLTDIDGIGYPEAEALDEAGYSSVATLRRATTAELADVPRIPYGVAMRITDDLGDASTADADDDLLDVDAIQPRHAKALRRAGYEGVSALRRAEYGELVDLDGIGRRVATKIKSEVGHEDTPRPAREGAGEAGTGPGGRDGTGGGGSGSEELLDLESVRPRHANALREGGYGSVAALRRAEHRDLAGLNGISRKVATRIKNEVGHDDPSTGTGDEAVRSRSDGSSDDSGDAEPTDADELLELDGVRPRHAEALRTAGYGNVADLRRAEYDELTAVEGVGRRVATKIKSEVGHGDGAASDSGDEPDEGTTPADDEPPEGEGGAARWARSGTPPERVPGAPEGSLSYADIDRAERLGSGGNAEVYRATAAVGDDPVELALKIPRMDGTLHTEAVERLLSEAETWAKLDDHDHVVGVVDYGAEPLPWIAMEHMDAGHLGERAGDLPVDQALWTALATTRAVRHAHEYGVAHLDLKPENVLFRAVEGGWDVPKVADWGLSKRLLDHSGSVDEFTPHYAAPEQIEEDGTVDKTTDIYGLGAICYELFTGRPPFEGPQPEVVNRIRTDEPTPPSDVADVSPALDEVVLTAMATAREDRYEHVLYLRDDLQDLFESL